MSPKMSVILPVYNVASYLRDCFNSLINQTSTDIEIICINDGSTDDSLENLSKYAQKDNRFIVVSHEDKGQGVARNIGVELAKGEWIKYVKKVVTWHYSQVSDESIKRYENMCLQYFSDEKETEKFLKEIKTKRSFLEQVFSLKNEYKDVIKYKVVTV